MELFEGKLEVLSDPSMQLAHQLSANMKTFTTKY